LDTAYKAADTSLTTKINTEKARIDAILSTAAADKDTFAEIVTLINSVDTTNDTAFAGYVTSNNTALAAEVTARQNADTALQTAINGKLASTGTAATATKLATARTIALTGGVTGSVIFDGSVNASIAATVANDSHTHSTYSPIANPTFTGTAGFAGIKETKITMAAATNFNLATGTFFTKTISAATTFTVSSIPAAGSVVSFILELTNAGSATITWFSGVKWASGTAPTLTAAGVDILGFYTHDGGVTWRGMVLAKDSK
jgi:hypothetical protein